MGRKGGFKRRAAAIALGVAVSVAGGGITAGPAASQQLTHGELDLTVTPASPQHVGQQITVTAFHPDPCTDRHNLNVVFEVFGANPQRHEVDLDRATGTASFSYTGVEPGEDLITAEIEYYPLFDPCEARYGRSSFSFTWTRDFAACDSSCITAGGSSVRFVKNTGSPVGGAVVFECDVEAPGARQVSIERCVSGPASAPRITMSGGSAMTAGAFTTESTEEFDVCWTVVAVFGSEGVEKSGCNRGGT